MRILTSSQVRQWDDYTIQHEPIASVDLMERAASACRDWIIRYFPAAQRFVFFCGKGNNGGDGLALARMLIRQGLELSVNILEFGHKGTDDFQANLARLHEIPHAPRFISSEDTIPLLKPGEIVIDALLGSGLNRPVDGLTAAIVRHINESGNEVIAIDIPSGLSADTSSVGHTAIHANHTLGFQCYKPAFIMPENQGLLGNVSILDIGLHPGFQLSDSYNWVDDAYVRRIYRKRPEFAHKGNFGHALLCAGSYGKMGAAVLAAKACLRSGSGLVTVHAPACGYQILQASIPEVMMLADADEKYISVVPPQPDKYQVIGIGPGIGTEPVTAAFLKNTVENSAAPLVLDADALNLLAKDPGLLPGLKNRAVLTPHPKEFERLFGKTANDFARIELLRAKAIEYQLFILLKGRFSCVATPEGSLYVNSSGNPGMATGGSGDVLTGIITSLAGQGYSLQDAVLLGCYLHGIAGDLAAAALSQEAMIAGDLIEFLPQAFKILFYDTEESMEY